MQINEKDIIWDKPQEQPENINEKDIVWDNEESDGFKSWDDAGELKKTEALQGYEQDNRSFLTKVKDGFVNNFVKPVATAVQDAANIATPVGEVDLGEYYDPAIKKDFAKLIGMQGDKNDLDLQAYNAINKLAKTHLDFDLDESNNEANLKTYEQNLANVVINNLGYDDVVKDEDGKYYAVKGDEEVQLNKDGFKEILSDIYGDKIEVIGAMIGADKGYDIGKNFGTKGKIAGTIVGGGIGAATGNAVDMLDSFLETGEKLNAQQRLAELNKAAALDMAGGIAVGTVMEGVPAAGKYVKDINPFTTDKQAQKYIKNDLNTNSETLKRTEDLAKGFGGTKDQALTKLADQQDTQAVLHDNFQSSLEQVNTYLDDMGDFTNNIYNRMGVNDIDADAIASVDEKVAGNLSEQINSLEDFYKANYNRTRQDIIQISGNESIQTPSSTLSTTQKLLNSLAKPQNIKGQQLKTGGDITEFQKDYATLTKVINDRFKMDEAIKDEAGNIIDYQKVDSDGYNLTGLMDVQKEFNDFFYKYKDDFSAGQKEKLGQIKDAIYDDMKNYVNRKFGVNSDAAKDVIGKWEDVNADYGMWKADKSRFKNFDKMLDSNIDITTLANDMITKTGDIDKDHVDFLGALAKHIDKTDPAKLDNLYDGVVNNLLHKSSIKTPINGEQRRIIDFQSFIENYDKVQKQSLNKIFGQTEKGRNILKTFEDLRSIADYEDYIQQNLLKRGQNLTEAVKVATEYKQSFLFGVEYFLRRYIVSKVSDKLFRSEAYKTYINQLAKKKRYSKDDSLKALDFTINKSKSKSSGFDKSEVEELKALRVQGMAAQEEIMKMQRETVAAMKAAKEKEEKEAIAKQFTKDAKAYMDNKVNEMASTALPAPKGDTDLGTQAGLNRQMDVERIARFDELSDKSLRTRLDRANVSPDELKLRKLNNELEKLKKDPYYEQIIQTARERKARDTYSPNTRLNDAQLISNDGQGGYEYDFIPPTDTKNWDHGYKVNMQKAAQIDQGKLTPELIDDLEHDLELLKRNDQQYTAPDEQIKNDILDKDLQDEGYYLNEDNMLVSPDGTVLFLPNHNIAKMIFYQKGI